MIPYFELTFHQYLLVVLTSDRDTMKFGRWTGELAVGDRRGSAVERVHATGENPPLTGRNAGLKLLVKLYGAQKRCRELSRGA